MMFDTVSYLNEIGVNYWFEGKNVSRDWLGVRCIWCDDRSNHLGISPDGNMLKCWRCGAKKNMVQYIMAIEKCNFATAKSIAKKYTIGYIPKEDDVEVVHKVDVPLGVKDKFKNMHHRYLRSRGFNPSFIRKTFKLKAGGYIGPFKYRIVAPVFENEKIVTYLGRDVTNKSLLPYKNLSAKKSIVPAKHCIYNIDNVDDTAIIVEGITDVWRLGYYGVVATLGLVFTSAQVNRLAAKLNRCYIMFDSDKQAISQAEELANQLSMSGIGTVEILELDEGDPADLTKNEVVELRKSIFGKL